MSRFIPDDEAIAELLELSELEEQDSDFEGDVDFFCPELAPDDPVPIPLNEWEKIPFKSKKVLEKLPVPIAEPRKPIEYFTKYVPDEIFEQIAVHTKTALAAREKLNTYCNVEFMKKFFGCHFLMGIYKCPQKELYFHPTFKYAPIANAVTRDKFKQTRLCLRVVDEANPDELEKITNRLWKVQPLIDTVRMRCEQIPRDCTHYSIGDQYIDFLGYRLGTKYNWTSQPVGLKNFIVTNATGLIVDFEIYQGSLTDLPDRPLGAPAAIVLRLSRTLPNSCLYFDKHFTTLTLMDELLNRNMEGTGIINPNKIKYEFSNNLEPYKWEEITRADKKMCAINWVDLRKNTILVSTAFGTKPKASIIKMDKITKENNTIPCPKALNMYNRHIIGISLNNQLIDQFTSPFKSKKWRVNLILYLFDLAIVNSFLEYQEDAKKCNVADQLDVVAFILSVSEHLLGIATEKTVDVPMEIDKPSGTRIPMYKPPSLNKLIDRFDGKNHWLVCDKSIKSQRICRREKCKSRTNMMCSKCKIYLCFNYNKNCFYTFHNKDEMKQDTVVNIQGATENGAAGL